MGVPGRSETMRLGMRTISSAIGTALILLAAVVPVRGHEEITPGQTIEDTLDEDEWSREFTFDGHEDDFVTILLLDAEDKDNVSVSVELTGPDGSFASDTDDRAAMIRAHRLRDDGEYKITVRRGGFWGTQFGFQEKFKFVLSLISTASTNDGGVISYNQTVRADLTPDGDLDGYRFHGRDGDHIKIKVVNFEDLGDFTANVDLIGPDGLVDHDEDQDTAKIDVDLDHSGDYTIVVWGGDPDWEGGPYELQLIGPGGPPPPPPTPTPLPLPDPRFISCTVGPVAPTRLHPGDPIVLGCMLENPGVDAGPFWLEFWGSRTGGLTLDTFLTDSQYVPGLAAFGIYPFDAMRRLYELPDGPYSVVMVVDRTNMISEYDEKNNRVVLAGKRILTLRPLRNVDLVVSGFNITPLPPQPGHSANLSGAVRNTGTESSGPFWIEFWQSPPGPYPQLGRMICDSIPISGLAAGGTINLGAYPRAIYSDAPTNGQFGVVVDRLDTVNETDEANNCQFVSADPPPGTPVLEITSADFTPGAPAELQPGMPVSFTGDIVNHDSTASGSFWVEFWGSRTGGMTLDMFLADSLPINDLAAGQTYHLNLTRAVYDVPDGPYTVVVTADRPSGGNYGRRMVIGKKLLVIRPASQANLKLENFKFHSSLDVFHGQTATPSGTVTNSGSEASGPFWIEFWASRDQLYPSLEQMACDSIYVNGLAPGASINLANYPRLVYNLGHNVYAIGCFVDRLDTVSETDETDNYMFGTGYIVY